MRRNTLLLSAFLAVPATVAAQGAPVALDTLRVSVASRLDPAFAAHTRAVEIIDAAAIRRMPAHNIADVLAWATGADVLARSAAQADVSLRGSTGEQVLVLVDGVRMSDRQTAHFALDLAVPLDQVERIEILRGAASAVHGADAVGGVINIVTRGAAAPQLSVRGDVARHSSFGASINGAGVIGQLTANGGAEMRRSDGFRPGTDYRIAEAHARVATLLLAQPLTFDFGAATRDFGARAFYTSPGAPFDEYEETRTATARLAWTGEIRQRFTVEPRLSVRRHSDMFVLRRADPSFYRNEHESWQSGAELIGRTLLAGVRMAIGGETYHDVLRSSSLGDRDETRAAGFGEVAFESGALQANAGARLDWHSEFGSFVAPSAAAALTVHPRIKVHASAGRAFRAPSWTERYYNDPANVGDPSLGPERAVEVEFGVRAEGAAARAGVTAFVRSTDGLIDWIRPAGSTPTTRWRAESVRSARLQGIEVDARVTDRFSTMYSGSFSGIGLTSDGRDGMESKYALRPITHAARIGVERALAGPVAGSVRVARMRRSGGQAYTRADARVQAIVQRARVYVDLLNLNNADYLDVSGLRAPGRAAHAGIEWSW